MTRITVALGRAPAPAARTSAATPLKASSLTSCIVARSVHVARLSAMDLERLAAALALQVAGVTGTSGKTTTAFLLYAILAAAGRRPGLVGTVETRIGGERRKLPRTTPEAIDLQRLFREMLDVGDRSAAIEASSHA